MGGDTDGCDRCGVPHGRNVLLESVQHSPDVVKVGAVGTELQKLGGCGGGVGGGGWGGRGS